VVIAGLLATTLAAAAWVRNSNDDPDVEVVGAGSRGKKEQARSPASGPVQADASRGTSPQNGTRPANARINLDKLATRNPGELVRDPFAAPAVKMKTPKSGGTGPTSKGNAAPAPPASRPTAPPVPFTYMGKLRSGADTAVFLTQGDRNLVLREGDTVDSIYRVEHIADSAITLIYLPLNERQTVPVGETP
jgi:hypothetical protein